MEHKTKKAAEAAKSDLQCKVNSSTTIKQQIRGLFLRGGRYTARDLNEIIGFNDARKVISDLRNLEGWDIKDIHLSDGRKLYWLNKDERQLSLFSENRKGLQHVGDIVTNIIQRGGER